MLSPVGYWKALSIVVFPLIVTTGISLSACLGSKSTHRMWFTCGVLFSAGVLLSGGLVHMLPEANEMYAELRQRDADDNDDGNDEDDEEDFPLPNVVFVLTFLVLLAVEVAAHRFAGAFYPDFSSGSAHSHRQHNHDGYSQNGFTAEESTTLLCNVKEDVERQQPPHANGYCASKSCQRFMTFPFVRPGVALESKSTSLMTAASSSQSFADQSHAGSPPPPPPPHGNGHTSNGHTSNGHTTSHDEKNQNYKTAQFQKNKNKTSPWVAVLLLVVLSIHVLIEDITLGSTASVESIRDIFVAIVFHKGFSAFALGSGLLSAGFLDDDQEGGGERKRTFYLLCATFLAMDPLGISIGWGLSSVLPPESYTEAMLQSMLGGSFLFVSLIELIPGELEKTRNHGYPLAFVLSSLFLGFGAMTLLGLWL